MTEAYEHLQEAAGAAGYASRRVLADDQDLIEYVHKAVLGAGKLMGLAHVDPDSDGFECVSNALMRALLALPDTWSRYSGASEKEKARAIVADWLMEAGTRLDEMARQAWDDLLESARVHDAETRDD